MDWRNFMLVDVQAQMRIRNGLDPTDIFAISELITIPPNGFGALVINADIPEAKNVVYEARAVGGNLESGEGILYIQGVPPEGPPPTKFWCGTAPFFRPI